jgi:hypothetical protein
MSEVRIPVPGSGILIDYASRDERERSLRLAQARQQIAHDGCFLPSWAELTDAEQEIAAVEARNWLRAAVNACLVTVAAGREPAQLGPQVAAGRAAVRQALIRWRGAWDIAGTGLANAAERLLGALDGEPPCPADQDVYLLDGDQVATVLAALDTAVEYREYRASMPCPACDNHPAGLCSDHQADLEAAEAYRALADRIEDATR